MAIGQSDTERVELEPRISAQIIGPREAAAAPLEISKDPVSPFAMKRVEALFEEALVIHTPADCHYFGGGKFWITSPGGGVVKWLRGPSTPSLCPSYPIDVTV
jgi:hypothetical protein